MRVKKYKIMPYVRLSTVILFLFTLVPRVAFSIYEVFTGNGGPILPAADMEDISVEDLFPSLQFDLSSFSQDNIVDEYEQFQIQLGSARIENWFQTLDGFHSSLNSKLEQIEFYQRAIEMDLSRLRGVEYLTRAEGEQLGFNSGEVKNQLQEKYELLQGAKQLIQNQIQQIQIIYDTLVNLGLNEFSVDEATRNLLGRDIQEFMNELPNMSEDQLREAVNRWRDKLVDVQYAINSNTRMLQEIERTLISISGNDFPSHALRKFLSDVYSSVYNLNQDYLHYQDLLSKYLTRKDLLVRIQSDLNRLKEHMDNFKFLFQPGVEVSLCYLEKILRNLPLDKRQEIIPALRSDFNDMIRLYKNLTQYEDLLSHNQDWLDIHSKMSIQGGYGMEGGRNYIARFNNLLRGVDIQEGNLLVDYFLNPENSSPDFRLAQYVIFLNLTLSKVEQDPEALTELNVRDDFLNKLRDFMLDFNEMGKGIDFLRDKISPSLIETFSHSYYDVLEQTLGGIPYESVSILERVVSLIEYARDCQQKIGQLQDRLQQISDPVITGHGVRFNFEEIEEIEHQIQVLTAERDKALDHAETSLSRIGVNPDDSSGWIDVLPENPSPQQPGTETTPISPQSTPDGPSSEPKVSTQAVDDKTARVTTQSAPPQSPSDGDQKVSTQAAGDGDERRTLTTQSPSSQRDGDQKVSIQAAGDDKTATLTTQSASSQQDGDQKVSAQAAGDSPSSQQQDGEPGNTTGNYQFDPGYEDPEQTGIDPDQEATQGDLIGDGGLLTAQETEEDGLLPTSPSRPDLNFPQGVGDEDGDNPGVPGVRKATTIFGNDHPIVGGDTPPSYDKTGDFPVPSENTINDYIIMIGDRLF
ncbi:MAG: hypothetical protein J7J54_01960, partial [Candidatus Omnitrophica bacterium]|nr:hypothetical protein [Candidatus Omnitrophota bacterium]